MALDIDFSNIPFAKEISPCGYYTENECTQVFNMTNWFDEPDFNPSPKDFPLKEYYGFLKQNGFCRYSSVFYRYECKNCKQCAPIRIPVNQFKPSKNQRAAWNKNQDIEVILEKNPEKFVSEEKAYLFREYDAYHNQNQPEFKKKTIQEALETLTEMNSGYEGVWNLEYRLNGRLVGVSLIDYTVDGFGAIKSICSNYFYYEISEEISRRSIGVFSVLKELELCRELKVEYYYLGLYLPNCQKMNYKSNYEPYELLIDGVWVNSDFKLPKPGEIYEEYPEVCFVTENIEPYVLLTAYRNGIFPWFNEEDGQPVIWQSTDPRFVIPVEKFHVPKTLKKFIKHSPYSYTMDKCFDRVMKECGKMERAGQTGTWIGPKMLKAYSEFHKMGYAHSIEVWHNDELVGGFYGILIGSVFCGESMFTIESYSSSSAFVLFAKAFEKCGGQIIDCQSYTDNMQRYGAIEIPRDEYLNLSKKFQRIRLNRNLKETFIETISESVKKKDYSL